MKPSGSQSEWVSIQWKSRVRDRRNPTIAAQTPEERDHAVDRKQSILAQWEVGSGGIRWLLQLVKDGKASQLAFTGYPNRFTARAGEILPLLDNGPPPRDVLPPGWIDKVIFHADKIAACPADQMLTIDAWDLS